MTVTPSRLQGIDHTTGDEKMVKLGGSLSFSGNTLIDGAITITNGNSTVDQCVSTRYLQSSGRSSADIAAVDNYSSNR